MAICCFRGVEPTRKPVLRSCDVVPPFDAAMQTIPPTESAVTKYGFGAVQPMARNISEVNSNVATVIPEIGFDDEPTSPVSRDETVTNKKPKMTISKAPKKPTLSVGINEIAAISSSMPITTHFIEMSWSMRSMLVFSPFDEPRKSESPAFSPCQIVGSERPKLIRPPATTAPAPM